MLKLLSRIKGKKNHTFLGIFKHKNCIVKELVLDQALDQQPKSDLERTLEVLMANLE